MTKDPKPGDLVVFQDRGDGGNKGHGHVTFFLEMKDKETVTVLGGNQRGDTGSTGAVCITDMKTDTNSHFLHSFRSIS